MSNITRFKCLSPEERKSDKCCDYDLKRRFVWGGKRHRVGFAIVCFGMMLGDRTACVVEFVCLHVSLLQRLYMFLTAICRVNNANLLGL